MYYLVIRNLGVDKCIDSGKTDKYVNDHTYDCLQNIPFVSNVKVKRIKIRCAGNPHRLINATVFSD